MLSRNKMKHHWLSPIELDVARWAVKVVETNGTISYALSTGASHWFHTRNDARKRAAFFNTRDYVKRATVIKVRITKED